MSNRSFKKFLAETPIVGYDTVGDFSKNSSFRKRDRFLITNPKTVEVVKKKFNNTDHNFNLLFVNDKKASKYVEVGVVDIHQIEGMLGAEVAKKISDSYDNDSINVIFTNNYGEQGAPMTSWIIAHRIMHAAARVGHMRDHKSIYVNASNHLLETFSNIMEECYGVSNIPKEERKMFYAQDYKSLRKNQLAMKNFFQKVATFRSAREGIIRDWFEVLNELGAQYLTTGRIRFNKVPDKFLAGGRNYYLRSDQAEYANQLLRTLSTDMKYLIDDIFYSLTGKVLIM